MIHSIPCDIVILPSEDLAGKAIAASQTLHQFESLFTLDGVNYYPHASLYMVQLKLDDIEKVKALLAGVAEHTSAPQVDAEKYDHTMNFVDVEYRKTAELESLQSSVIGA